MSIVNAITLGVMFVHVAVTSLIMTAIASIFTDVITYTSMFAFQITWNVIFHVMRPSSFGEYKTGLLALWSLPGCNRNS